MFAIIINPYIAKPKGAIYIQYISNNLRECQKICDQYKNEKFCIVRMYRNNEKL